MSEGLEHTGLPEQSFHEGHRRLASPGGFDLTHVPPLLIEECVQRCEFRLLAERDRLQFITFFIEQPAEDVVDEPASNRLPPLMKRRMSA